MWRILWLVFAEEAVTNVCIPHVVVYRAEASHNSVLSAIHGEMFPTAGFYGEDYVGANLVIHGNWEMSRPPLKLIKSGWRCWCNKRLGETNCTSLSCLYIYTHTHPSNELTPAFMRYVSSIRRLYLNRVCEHKV